MSERRGEPPGPRLPFGRRIELAGRGTTFVREVCGPPGAPTLLLLHGWLASGGLNWFLAFQPLAAHFRVVAPDLRGHGRGIRSRHRATLADCADDVAALVEALGCGPVIPVGYSLGGAVAQLLWHRHRRLVDGLVLCATSHRLMPGRPEQWLFTPFMTAVARCVRWAQLAAGPPVGCARVVRRLAPRPRPTTMGQWAMAEMARHDWRMVLDIGAAMGRFSAERWIGEVDVPTAVLITTGDRAIRPLAQAAMALEIPTATIHRVHGGHTVCAQPHFTGPLVAACLEVAERIASLEPAVPLPHAS